MVQTMTVLSAKVAGMSPTLSFRMIKGDQTFNRFDIEHFRNLFMV